MIGVLIDHDRVAVPVPVPDETDVVGSNAEIESAEPKTVGTSSFEMEDVSRPKSAGEVSMFERMIQMIVGIVAPCIMADPVTVGVHVRSVGMSGSIVEIGRLRGAMFLAWSRTFLVCRRRTVGWNEPSILMRGLAFASLTIGIACANSGSEGAG